MHSEFVATYHVSTEDVTKEGLTLRESEAHHATVNRQRSGDRIIASDGRGMAYECTILAMSRGQVEAKIDRTVPNRGEPALRLTLAVALPLKSKFEWIVEKGTEIGVSEFIPLLSERTLAKAVSVKHDRCTRIALAAMKQSCRSKCPEIRPAVSMRQLLNVGDDYDCKALAHESSRQLNMRSLLDLSGQGPVCWKSGLLCIGPEGGFTDDEVQSAADNGFGIVGLGPRRLRTETAALVASALVLDVFGELDG